MDTTTAQPRFGLGQLVATPAALATLSPMIIALALSRHRDGDWGDVCPEDWELNDRALIFGQRLFSVYHSPDATCFWIITAADRSYTTVLLPTDY